jgi:cytochrome b6-f complex iron-sulfur subunit
MTDGPKESVARRRFIKGILSGVGACYAAAIGYPVYRYLTSPAERAAALSAVTELILTGAQLLPAGSVMMFKFGSRPSMLIHHRDGGWAALDAVCTHLGCTVQYQSDRDVIHCFCHGGEYDSRTGKNVSGPPPRPLRSYQARVVADGVLVSRA